MVNLRYIAHNFSKFYFIIYSEKSKMPLNSRVKLSFHLDSIEYYNSVNILVGGNTIYKLRVKIQINSNFLLFFYSKVNLVYIVNNFPLFINV